MTYMDPTLEEQFAFDYAPQQLVRLGVFMFIVISAATTSAVFISLDASQRFWYMSLVLVSIVYIAAFHRDPRPQPPPPEQGYILDLDVDDQHLQQPPTSTFAAMRRRPFVREIAGSVILTLLNLCLLTALPQFQRCWGDSFAELQSQEGPKETDDNFCTTRVDVRFGIAGLVLFLFLKPRILILMPCAFALLVLAAGNFAADAAHDQNLFSAHNAREDIEWHDFAINTAQYATALVLLIAFATLREWSHRLRMERILRAAALQRRLAHITRASNRLRAVMLPRGCLLPQVLGGRTLHDAAAFAPVTAFSASNIVVLHAEIAQMADALRSKEATKFRAAFAVRRALLRYVSTVLSTHGLAVVCSAGDTIVASNAFLPRDEEDASRYCRCAFALLTAARELAVAPKELTAVNAIHPGAASFLVRLKFRIGIHMGEGRGDIIAGDMTAARGSAAQNLVLSGPVFKIARVASKMTNPGTVLISDRVRRLVRRNFVCTAVTPPYQIGGATVSCFVLGRERLTDGARSDTSSLASSIASSARSGASPLAPQLGPGASVGSEDSSNLSLFALREAQLGVSNEQTTIIHSGGSPDDDVEMRASTEVLPPFPDGQRLGTPTRPLTPLRPRTIEDGVGGVLDRVASIAAEQPAADAPEWVVLAGVNGLVTSRQAMSQVVASIPLPYKERFGWRQGRLFHDDAINNRLQEFTLRIRGRPTLASASCFGIVAALVDMLSASVGDRELAVTRSTILFLCLVSCVGTFALSFSRISARRVAVACGVQLALVVPLIVVAMGWFGTPNNPARRVADVGIALLAFGMIPTISILVQVKPLYFACYCGVPMGLALPLAMGLYQFWFELLLRLVVMGGFGFVWFCIVRLDDIALFLSTVALKCVHDSGAAVKQSSVETLVSAVPSFMAEAVRAQFNRRTSQHGARLSQAATVDEPLEVAPAPSELEVYAPEACVLVLEPDLASWPAHSNLLEAAAVRGLSTAIADFELAADGVVGSATWYQCGLTWYILGNVAPAGRTGHAGAWRDKLLALAAHVATTMSAPGNPTPLKLRAGLARGAVIAGLVQTSGSSWATDALGAPVLRACALCREAAPNTLLVAVAGLDSHGRPKLPESFTLCERTN
jgi:class 3 adenylate cyclase